MAKNNDTVELTVEGLVAAGYTQEDAEAICGANEQGGSQLPFSIAKILYDAEVPHLAKKGTWVADIVKDKDGEIESLTAFGDTITMTVLGSFCQYSRYNAATNSADITSNIFHMSGAKAARDTKTGKLISELKKINPDSKITFQEIILCMISSELQPEPKPYIMYASKSFLYSLNNCRKSLPNRGNVVYTLTFKLKMLKNGNTKYYIVDEDTFKATPKSITEIRKAASVIPEYIKTFNSWVASVNDKDSVPATQETAPMEDEDEEDEIAF